jgi:hypothetical protein
MDIYYYPLEDKMFLSKELKKFTEDLSPLYREELISIIEKEIPKNRTETDRILAKFRIEKGFVKVGKFTNKYWEQRGWSSEEASAKKKQNRVNNIPHGSPMQIEYWLKKTNPRTGHNYTKEEAQYKIKSQRKFNIEYWIERGLSKEDSISMIKKIQKENSSKRKKYKGVTWNQYEYWMSKENISEKEAKEKVSNLQKTYDLERIISKYGIIEGNKRYTEMCRNLSYSQSLDGFIERYGEELGKKKYGDAIIKRCSNSGVSRESLIFFKKIYKDIRKKINRNEIYWGIKGSREYFLYDSESKKIFFYDFTIPSIGIILEYHGKRYHPNPKWNTEKWEKWNFLGISADEKRILDVYKNNLGEKNGFEVIEIFSDNINENTQVDIINKILEKFSQSSL